MSADWKEYKLTDLYEISSGLSKPASAFGSGFPFLSFKEVFNNYFLPDELEQLVESSEKERQKGAIKRGDVFLTRTSETMHELGMSSVALKDYEEATFNGFSKKLRPKPETASLLHPEFIGYSLRSPSFRTSMLAFSTMSTRASLNNEMIGRLTITLPDINDQIRIARILKSLDDKAAINKDINQTLEQIAQAIFKSWFVDFEPVKAKIAAREALVAESQAQSGKTPSPQEIAAVEKKAAIAAIAGAGDIVPTAQLQTLADLFPNQLVESELGEIPEGWEGNVLGEHINVLNGFAFKSKDYTEKGTFVLRTKNFNGDSLVDNLGDDVFLPEKFLTSHKKYLCEPFDYHLIMVGASVGNRGLIFPNQLPALRNQNMWCLRPKPNSSLGKAFTKYLLDSLVDKTRGLASGSAREFFRKGDFQQQSIPLASKKLNEKFEELVMPMLEQQSSIYAESEALKSIRDVLLPKLLSGEIELAINQKDLASA